MGEKNNKYKMNNSKIIVKIYSALNNFIIKPVCEDTFLIQLLKEMFRFNTFFAPPLPLLEFLLIFFRGGLVGTQFQQLPTPTFVLTAQFSNPHWKPSEIHQRSQKAGGPFTNRSAAGAKWEASCHAARCYSWLPLVNLPELGI